MEINILTLSSIQLCVKEYFLAHKVSEIALKVPNHVVTPENKDKLVCVCFPGVWGGEKNKGRAE